MVLTLYDVFYHAFLEKGYPEWLADIKAKEWAADAERWRKEAYFKEALKNKGKKVYKPTFKQKGDGETLHDYLIFCGFKDKTAMKIASARSNPMMEQLENENMVMKKRARKRGGK